MIMTKNILKGDMVYHMKIIMQSRLKIALPLVTFPSLFGASHLLKDEPHPSAKPSCQKNLGKDIKLNHNSLVRL